jgi:hypothetical protein
LVPATVYSSRKAGIVVYGLVSKPSSEIYPLLLSAVIFSWLLFRAIEIHEAIAIINSQSEEIQERQNQRNRKPPFLGGGSAPTD